MSDMTIDEYTDAGGIDASVDYFLVQQNSTNSYRKINRNTILGNSGTPVTTTASQTLQNKTLDNSNILTIRDDRFTLQDSGDTTKQAQFQLSGITTATTRTYTLPNASSTLADISTSQTITNKTLTAPVINNGSITGTTITTDAIIGQSASTSGTIYGLSVASSKVGTNGVVTASITDAAVTPAKLFAGTGASWTWQTYMPTFTNFTSTTATITAAYSQTGKTVNFRLKVVLGGSSAVTGAITFSVPVAMSAAYTSDTDLINSSVGILDNGTTYYLGMLRWATSTTLQLFSVNAASTTAQIGTVSSTVPMTWTTGDAFIINGSYEAA